MRSVVGRGECERFDKKTTKRHIDAVVAFLAGPKPLRWSRASKIF